MKKMRKAWTNRWMLRSAVLFAFACVVLSGTGTLVSAQTSGGFSIRAVIPDNQLDTKQTYFDLRMKPGDEQDIEVIITNSRTEELTAEVRLNAASTGRNGLIVYTEPDVRDESMKVAVTDVAALQTQSVTVPALGSETVTIHIKMPEESFDGVILGGIAVTGNEIGDELPAARGVSLKNTITYVTALKLTENDHEVPPDFDLAAITPSLVNYRTAVVATLSNRAARIAKNMDISAQVYHKGSDAVLHELALEGAEMAPLSTGDFVIDWESEALRPGPYRLRMTAGYEGRTWEWDEEFTISGEANELNKEAVGIRKDYTWLYVLLGVAALALVWLAAYRLGRRKTNGDR